MYVHFIKYYVCTSHQNSPIMPDLDSQPLSMERVDILNPYDRTKIFLSGTINVVDLYDTFELDDSSCMYGHEYRALMLFTVATLCVPFGAIFIKQIKLLLI